MHSRRGHTIMDRPVAHLGDVAVLPSGETMPDVSVVEPGGPDHDRQVDPPRHRRGHSPAAGTTTDKIGALSNADANFLE